MSETADPRPVAESGLDLKSTIRQVKNDMADRDDVVVEMREAQRMRLDMLAQELAPVFADIPAGDDRFDLTVSAGLQPRLWIDAVTHVVMGRDRRTFRFLRDTRLGRVVLCESLDLKTVAEHVTRYVAERVVERERVLEGDLGAGGADRTMVASEAQSTPPQRSAQEATPAPVAQKAPMARTVLSGLGILLLGMIAGGALVAALAWERFVAFFGFSL